MLILLACAPRGPAILTAEELDVVAQSEAIVGRDGGSSARLWDRSVWTFGDTVLSVEDTLGQTWHHNSYAWTEDTDASDGITGLTEPTDEAGAPRHLIPPSDSELAFNLEHYGDDCAVSPCGARWAVWPGSPVWDEAGQRALVSYGLIYAEPGDFNFHGVGQSWAIWTDPDAQPQRPVIDADAEHPDLIWGEGEPGWGVGAILEEEYLYTFACDTDFLSNPCSLASAPLVELQERTAWRYFNGSGWSADMDDARPLFDGAPIMSVSWSAWLGAYLVVYSPPFSPDILARTAPELTGPWSRPTVLYTAQGEEPYDAVQHAELDSGDGSVLYITWSRPTGAGWFDAELALLEVEWE